MLKAARLLGERVGDLKAGEFMLDKVLPVAAGIGGGSADAAAALRLLARANKLELDDPRLTEVAQLTGADVPVCLGSHACVMTGVGETLLPLTLPKMPCVLVNPCVPVATSDVFKALGLRHGELLVGATDVILYDPTWPEAGASIDAWIKVLGRHRQRSGETGDAHPARHRRGIDGACATAGARLARMSGSGATCFAIFNDDADAQRAAQAIQLEHPAWWVHAGALS